MSVLLWLWQIPQNIIGFLLVLATKAVKKTVKIEGMEYIIWVAQRLNGNWSGVSLGNYVVFANNRFADEDSVKHEHGHQIQSAYTGPLYILIIGIPSFFGNIYDRIAHSNWTYIQRVTWYYNQPWERSADKLGYVERFK